MAKINLFFQDLPEDKKEEIIKQLKIELAEEIREDEEHQDEIIDNYINTHNFANEFKI